MQMTTIETPTLAQRLAEGRLPTTEALRISMRLAEALRILQEQGCVYGSLTPSSIALTPNGVDLLPADTSPGIITPYSAPELVQGRPADARSDIFAFGAIVYEMLTGRRAFDGDSPESLRTVLMNAPPQATDNPALDRFVTNCLAKDPSARCQRIQKAAMELKLLNISARSTVDRARWDHIQAIVREAVHQAESRIAARLESHETAVAELHKIVTGSFHSLLAQVGTIEAQLTSAQEQLVRAEESVTTMNLQMSALKDSVQADGGRISGAEIALRSDGERLAYAEQAVETMRRHVAEFSESGGVRLDAFEQALKAQADTIESAKMAIGQTDDLVERVVEALESMQNVILEQAEDR
jgi:serine/threonine protein kinase